MKLIISVGSYERILYGIDVQIDKTHTSAIVKESFAIPAHTGYIKAVTSCPRYLASGGTDETIRLFDLYKRRDIGSLSQHQGSLTTLAFIGSSHLLSGGEDGRIGLFRCKDWESLHILRHKKPVQSLTVHPSGKLALSVGMERSLKLWNLMTGKQAHSSTLPVQPLKIIFSESGKFYAVLSEKAIHLYETSSAKLVKEVPSKTRLAVIAFLRDHVLYVAGEGSLVQIIPLEDINLSSPATITLETLQSPRIKGLAIFSTSNTDILITASSSGSIKGWGLNSNPTNVPLQPLFSHEAKIRITCLTVTSSPN